MCLMWLLTELWQNFDHKYASMDIFGYFVLLQNAQRFSSVLEGMCLNQNLVGMILIVSKAVKNWILSVLSISCTSLHTAACSSWVTIAVFLFLTTYPFVQVPKLSCLFSPWQMHHKYCICETFDSNQSFILQIKETNMLQFFFSFTLSAEHE